MLNEPLSRSSVKVLSIPPAKLGFLLLALTFGPLSVAHGDDDLAAAGTAIVKKHCYGCHGERHNGSAEFDVLDPVGLIQNGYVTKGNLEESEMWSRVEGGDMPPEDSGVPALTDTQKETLSKWIEAGAPAVQREKRAFIGADQVLKSIYADLLKVARDDREYKRYFGLTHLSNNYEAVSDHELRLHRAAFAKAINSLSFEPDIFVPVAIDEFQTVFRIDLRRLGWDAASWKSLVNRYPYGTHFQDGDDEELANVDEQVEMLTKSPISHIRIDWFVNTALRPPIYDRFVGTPRNVDTLERKLNVDFEKNFNENRIARAGFATSGVSVGNRLVERHPALHGYYWKSYDFVNGGARGNLFRYPLGPEYPGNPFPEAAFQHDGGEMIYSLPNGLQGYMLTDEKGNRLDVGPIAVVRDTKEISGTPQVMNGISCLHCHRRGLIGFKDTVRTGVAVFGNMKRKVRNLYPEDEAMQKIVEADNRRFLSALEKCVGPFLRVEGEDKDVSDYTEPVGPVVRFYQRDLNATAVACELGLKSGDELVAAVRANRELLRLGLGPLANGASIKRSVWESKEAFVSPFQEACRMLGLGTPAN